MKNKISNNPTQMPISKTERIRSFAVAWLHTTGPDITADNIFQIGGIKLDDDGKREEKVWLIDTKKRLTRTAIMRSGINNADLKFKPNLQNTLNEVQSFFGDCNIIFIPGFSNQVEWFKKKIFPNRTFLLHDLFILAQYFLPEIEVYDPTSLYYFTHKKKLPTRTMEPILNTSIRILHKIIEKILTDPRPFYRVLPSLLMMTGDRSLKVIARLVKDAQRFSFSTNMNIFERTQDQNSEFSITLDGTEILRPLWLKASLTRSKDEPVINNNQEEEDLKPISLNNVEQILDLIGKDIQKYKKRPKQSIYSNAISNALITADISFIESGTGTGKSLGYLLAGMDMLEKSKNKKLIISTSTKNLQSQLLEREIPRLSNRFPGLRATMLKGKGNYLCLSALKRSYRTCFEKNFAHDNDLQSRGAWIYLANLVHSLNNGDLEIIPRRLFAWFPKLREMIQDTNAASHCKSGSCDPELDIYGRIKQQAFTSDIIVTNHYKIPLLDQELMQSVKYFIIDEADQFGNAVRKSLSFKISSKEIRSYLKRLNGSNRRGYINILQEYVHGLKRKLDSEEKDNILSIIQNAKDGIIDLEISFKHSGKIFFDHLPEYEKKKIKRGILSNRDFLFEDLVGLDDGKELKRYCEDISMIMASLSKRLMEISEINKIARGHRDRCRTYALLSEEFANTIKTVGEEFDSNGVAHSLIMLNEIEWEVTRHQVYIGEFLRDAFYSKNKTMVYTSATLSVNNSFDHFKKQYGVDTEDLIVDERSIGTLIDHNKQSVTIVDTSISHYNYKNPDAMIKWRHDITRSIGTYGWAANGRTLVLFTSIQDMNYSFKSLEPFFHQFDIQPLIQNGSSLEEIDEFRRNEFSILFGVDRFWSGVDFPGVTLSQVIIVKAPNPSLSDPIIQYRNLHEPDFMQRDYNTIAKLRLKQGAGRLLRNEKDRGGIVILDSRYGTNPYFSNHLSVLDSNVLMASDQSVIINSILKKSGLISEYKLRGIEAKSIVDKYFNKKFKLTLTPIMNMRPMKKYFTI